MLDKTLLKKVGILVIDLLSHISQVPPEERKKILDDFYKTKKGGSSNASELNMDSNLKTVEEYEKVKTYEVQVLLSESVSKVLDKVKNNSKFIIVNDFPLDEYSSVDTFLIEFFKNRVDSIYINFLLDLVFSTKILTQKLECLSMDLEYDLYTLTDMTSEQLSGDITDLFAFSSNIQKALKTEEDMERETIKNCTFVIRYVTELLSDIYQLPKGEKSRFIDKLRKSLILFVEKNEESILNILESILENNIESRFFKVFNISRFLTMILLIRQTRTVLDSLKEQKVFHKISRKESKLTTSEANFLVSKYFKDIITVKNRGEPYYN